MRKDVEKETRKREKEKSKSSKRDTEGKITSPASARR